MKIIGLNKIIAITEPMTLKKICASAALFAFVEAPTEARYAVTVVPMFCPRQRAHAVYSPIHP